MCRSRRGWTGYRQAEAYFQCHGHLCPYQRRNAPLPAGLSQWLTAQRKAKQAGKLSPEKSRMLESVGMIWDVYQSLWETAYQQAEAYRSAPRAFAGLQGQWAGPVFRALDQHPAKKLQKGGPERGTDPKAGDPWNGVGCRGRFGRAVGTVVSKSLCVLCGPRASQPHGRRAAYLGAGPAGCKERKRGCLTEAQIQRLEGIGMVWEPLTDQWQEMYQHAKAYYQVHQMLNVPCNYSTETGVRAGTLDCPAAAVL